MISDRPASQSPEQVPFTQEEIDFCLEIFTTRLVSDLLIDVYKSSKETKPHIDADTCFITPRNFFNLIVNEYRESFPREWRDLRNVELVIIHINDLFLYLVKKGILAKHIFLNENDIQKTSFGLSEKAIFRLAQLRFPEDLASCKYPYVN